jgi:acetyl-CoA acetyltransferase
MVITRETVAHKLAAYLHHEISLANLVDWAQMAMMEGEFDDIDHDAIRDAVARLGLTDVRAFGLTWEDGETILKRLGYDTRIEIVAV